MVFFRAACLTAALARCSSAQENETFTKPYVPPSTEGLHWVETFDGDVFSRWYHSIDDRYSGMFKLAKRDQEALTGDVGLLMPDAARHYGIAAKFPPIVGDGEAPFVLQFEVKFQEKLDCGGAYVKLFNADDIEDEKDFNHNTPYTIMFGPDKCGDRSLIQFRYARRSATGELYDSATKDPGPVPRDNKTHLFKLVVHPNNSYFISTDGNRGVRGDLTQTMEPALWLAPMAEGEDKKEPGILPKISAIGIDIWTMEKGILLDNIVISSDEEAANVFAANTFFVREELEEMQLPGHKSKTKYRKPTWWDYADWYGVPISISTAMIIGIGSICFCICSDIDTDTDGKKDC